MHLSDEKVEEIISLYKSHECLWKKAHEDYKNKFKKESAYEAVAAAVNLEKSVVKEKLHSLRTIYFQNISKAKKIKSGNAGGKPIKWKFFGHLNFLSSEAADSGKTDSLFVS